MNWELIIHGTPEGQKVSASESGKADGHVANYYTENKGVFMKVEHAVSNGIPYCYYHYLHYGIAHQSGRAGGYLGITLRMDKCSERLSEMYSLLRLIYNQVSEVLLNEQKTSFKVAEIPQNLHPEMEKLVGLLLRLVVEPSKLTPPVSPLPQTQSLNLSDAESKNYIVAFQKGQSYPIAPEYPSLAVRSQLEAAMQEPLRLKQAMDKERSAWQHHEKQLRGDFEQKKGEADRLKEDLTRVQTQLAEKEKALEKAIKEKNAFQVHNQQELICNLQKALSLLQSSPSLTQDYRQLQRTGVGIHHQSLKRKNAISIWWEQCSVHLKAIFGIVGLIVVLAVAYFCFKFLP